MRVCPRGMARLKEGAGCLLEPLRRAAANLAAGLPTAGGRKAGSSARPCRGPALSLPPVISGSGLYTHLTKLFKGPELSLLTPSGRPSEATQPPQALKASGKKYREIKQWIE